MKGRMKHFTFDSHWAAIQGQLKQRYAQLTDDDLLFAEGKSEELLARLRQKIAISAEALEKLLNDLHADARGKWEQAKDKIGDLASDVREKAGAVADKVKAQTTAAYDEARHRAHTFHEDGEEYVRKHPGKSILLAVCVGLVAGLLIRR